MKISEAQKDMRQSYLGGGSGVLASGLIWLTAGIVAFYLTKQTSILVFFFGGMLIHPLGIVISKQTPAILGGITELIFAIIIIQLERKFHGIKKEKEA